MTPARPSCVQSFTGPGVLSPLVTAQTPVPWHLLNNGSGDPIPLGPAAIPKVLGPGLYSHTSPTPGPGTSSWEGDSPCSRGICHVPNSYPCSHSEPSLLSSWMSSQQPHREGGAAYTLGCGIVSHLRPWGPDTTEVSWVPAETSPPGPLMPEVGYGAFTGSQTILISEERHVVKPSAL